MLGSRAPLHYVKKKPPQHDGLRGGLPTTQGLGSWGAEHENPRRSLLSPHGGGNWWGPTTQPLTKGPAVHSGTTLPTGRPAGHSDSDALTTHRKNLLAHPSSLTAVRLPTPGRWLSVRDAHPDTGHLGTQQRRASALQTLASDPLRWVQPSEF